MTTQDILAKIEIHLECLQACSENGGFPKSAESHIRGIRDCLAVLLEKITGEILDHPSKA